MFVGVSKNTFSAIIFETFPPLIEIEYVKHFIKAEKNSKFIDSKALKLTQSNTHVDIAWSSHVMEKKCIF